MHHPRIASRFQVFTIFAAAGLTGLGGCGGQYANLGKVSGKVTLGGQPLAAAQVIFSPTGVGSPSAATTDASGAYTLQYVQNVSGAEVGEHHVTISTGRDADADADPPTPAVPEKVPFQYRSPGALRATVAKGANTLDFALEPGPIDEPKPGKGGKKK